MNDFEISKLVSKQEIKTDFGLVKVKNIELSPLMIENILPQIVLKDDNLMFMFQLNEFSSFERECVLKRFVPDEIITDLDEYITSSIKKHRTFYSFLAEGMLSLVFRDLHAFNLVKGIIEVGDTLYDTHSGVDSCMYDENINILVLGEAKFYEDFEQGINAVINDLTKNSIKNKLISLKKNTEANRSSKSIILKNLKLDNYKFLSINEFLKQKIVFSGFVLHSWNTDLDRITDEKLYDSFKVSEKMIKENIMKEIDVELENVEFEIIMYHLPIQSKKQLIKKIINNSLELLEKF